MLITGLTTDISNLPYIGNFLCGCNFRWVHNLLKLPKIDTAKNKPYYRPSRHHFRQHFPTGKFPNIQYENCMLCYRRPMSDDTSTNRTKVRSTEYLQVVLFSNQIFHHLEFLWGIYNGPGSILSVGKSKYIVIWLLQYETLIHDNNKWTVIGKIFFAMGRFQLFSMILKFSIGHFFI